MGTLISSIRENNICNGVISIERHEFEQRLNVVERMVHGQLDRKEAQVLATRVSNRHLNLGAVVDKMKFVNIINGRDVNVSVTINVVMKSFFGEVNSSVKETTLLIYDSIFSIVNKTSQGEFEAYDMLVLESGKLALRCDVYYYRWNFIPNNIRNIDGVVGVLLIKRLIDKKASVKGIITQYRTRNKRRIQRYVQSKLTTEKDDKGVYNCEEEEEEEVPRWTTNTEGGT